MQTSILPRKQKLVDPADHTEFQFGRDVPPTGSETPRLRLKEMEVSKLHATVYWDRKLQVWGVVDHGSMHGTFIKSDVGGSTAQAIPFGEQKGVRLSAPRAASIPRTLRHLDLLSIGSTTFLVHIHESRLTCDGCSTGSASEVPLSIASECRRGSTKRSNEVAGFDQLTPVDPRKALKMLKQNLVPKRSPHAMQTLAVDMNYVDRSARRRIQQPGSNILPLGLPVSAQTSSTPSRPHKPHPDRPSGMYMPPVSVSAPPTALADTNVGHRLLQKQGWQPGETLGQLGDFSAGGAESRTSLLEPICISANIGRAGIGMLSTAASVVPTVDTSVKKSVKQERWDSIQEGG
ncbi:hypothetical protein HWV62_2372 [Athelia sp. TMB]|nr:hypothetical protein HWV62_2372 [Athelia sp. TMB]